MVPLAHLRKSLPSNRYLDHFSRFCRDHKRYQQTHKHRPRYCVCSNRPHLAIVAMRPDNNLLLLFILKLFFIDELIVLSDALQNVYF